MKARMSGIYIKVGQIVNIDGKEYKLKSYSLCVSAKSTYKLTFERVTNYEKGAERQREEITMKDQELSEALGTEIYGFID